MSKNISPNDDGEKKYIPASVKEKLSVINRRQFLGGMAALGALATIPSIVPRVTQIQSGKSDQRDPQVLSEKEWNILKILHNHLLPDDGNGPSAGDVNATAYLQVVMTDRNIDQDHRDYLKKGIRWLDEEAQEFLQTPFLALNDTKREEVLYHYITHDYGESWVSLILLYLFEALLGDPIYGGNPDGIGWKWLDHYPGYPRPTEENKYKINTVNSR